MTNILSKSEILLKSLYIFYSVSENIEKILPILLGETILSIRAFEWFIINYSKKNNIIINNNLKSINVYLEYKLQLWTYIFINSSIPCDLSEFSDLFNKASK